MERKIIGIGALLAGLAVVLGAFGAHALEEFLIENNRLDTYQTAVRYHMYHSLALVFLGLLMQHQPAKLLKVSSYLLMAGIFIFSGSLYVLCATGITILGAITPIGGLFLIIAWLLIAFTMLRKRPA